MSEKVLGAIHATQSGGWGSGTKLTLFFTDKRIIVAKRKKDWLMRIGEVAGAFGGVAEGLANGYITSKKGEKPIKMSVEDVLKADKKNFAIDNSEVVSVELTETLMTVKTSEKKLDLLLDSIPGKKKKWYKSLKQEEFLHMLQPFADSGKLVKK